MPSKKPFTGMPNMGGGGMNQLMKQAQKMQQQMEETQAALEERTLDISSGGGAVKITINGKKELLNITISPDVVDPDDIEMLQDLVLTAVNEAVRAADDMYQGEMGKITGGLNLPF
ncbi:MAG: YbaB/EbfC family nucleoid-associated protein [Defluviitaleaceae bacterium]|nr:YbaB/EbfC family nucleoid-associated protein [Defluviitaleaceae bacterium]